MSVTLAIFATRAAGGIDSIKTKLAALGREDSTLGFLPQLDSPWLPALAFFVYISFNWWASWFPGSEPGGGGYVVQRMVSTRDERHSLLATLWFYIAHVAVRPWPWILVALVSMVTFPDLKDRESGYVLVMMEYLPSSLRGLMLAGFAAAFMSTISTHLNWGASYVINDFYRRFLKPEAPQEHFIRASRAVTVLLAVISAVITFYLESVAGAWKLLLVTGAGTLGQQSDDDEQAGDHSWHSSVTLMSYNHAGDHCHLHAEPGGTAPPQPRGNRATARARRSSD
jgi:SSS family solute:Na+ symporter